jgi:hypothetical protein
LAFLLALLLKSSPNNSVAAFSFYFAEIPPLASQECILPPKSRQLLRLFCG